MGVLLAVWVADGVTGTCWVSTGSGTNIVWVGVSRVPVGLGVSVGIDVSVGTSVEVGASVAVGGVPVAVGGVPMVVPVSRND